jgi:hypothetical protein
MEGRRFNATKDTRDYVCAFQTGADEHKKPKFCRRFFQQLFGAGFSFQRNEQWINERRLSEYKYKKQRAIQAGSLSSIFAHFWQLSRVLK